MANLLIISATDNAITQSIVEFPHVTYAEDALTEIYKANPGIGVRIIAVRLYDPYKGNKSG